MRATLQLYTHLGSLLELCQVHALTARVTHSHRHTCRVAMGASCQTHEKRFSRTSAVRQRSLLQRLRRTMSKGRSPDPFKENKKQEAKPRLEKAPSALARSAWLCVKKKKKRCHMTVNVLERSRPHTAAARVSRRIRPGQKQVTLIRSASTTPEPTTYSQSTRQT